MQTKGWKRMVESPLFVEKDGLRLASIRLHGTWTHQAGHLFSEGAILQHAN